MLEYYLAEMTGRGPVTASHMLFFPSGAESIMFTIRRSSAIAICALSLALCGSAAAQVPPHQPGTMCFTPQFWCWMQNVGVPGQICYCPTTYGPVQGVIG
jgi:hypothetical protein